MQYGALCVIAVEAYQRSAVGQPPNTAAYTVYFSRIGLDTMASNETATDLLFAKWDGQIVPRSFNGGFVTLSYIVSLIGAASTLELINRRTAPKGKVNQYVGPTTPNGDLSLNANAVSSAYCSVPPP